MRYFSRADVKKGISPGMMNEPRASEPRAFTPTAIDEPMPLRQARVISETQRQTFEALLDQQMIATGHDDDLCTAIQDFLSHPADEPLAPDVREKLIVPAKSLRGSRRQEDGANLRHLHRSARDFHDFGKDRDGNFGGSFCPDRQSDRRADSRKLRNAETRRTKPFQPLGMRPRRAQSADV